MPAVNDPAGMLAFGFRKPAPKTEAPPFEAFRVPRPQPVGRDLLVEVKAVAVNPTDWRTHAGKKPDDDSLTIVGRDAAGVVVETGPDCELFKPGDEVYYAGDNRRPGTHAEYHLVDERIVGRKPSRLSFAEAAAMPLTTITAWEALHDRLGIPRDAAANRGDSLLIIGAAGGVGSIATQLAKLAGLHVIGTASRPESSQWAKEHGADAVIDHRKSIAAQLRGAGLAGVRYIFVLTHVDQHFAEMADAILPQGGICSILPFEQPQNLQPLFAKSATLAWELMFTRPMFETDDRIEQHRLLNEAASLFDQGKLRTTMTGRLAPVNAGNLREAYRRSMSGTVIGKIVLKGFQEGGV